MTTGLEIGTLGLRIGRPGILDAGSGGFDSLPIPTGTLPVILDALPIPTDTWPVILDALPIPTDTWPVTLEPILKCAHRTPELFGNLGHRLLRLQNKTNRLIADGGGITNTWHDLPQKMSGETDPSDYRSFIPRLSCHAKNLSRTRVLEKLRYGTPEMLLQAVNAAKTQLDDNREYSQPLQKRRSVSILRARRVMLSVALISVMLGFVVVKGIRLWQPNNQGQLRNNDSHNVLPDDYVSKQYPLGLDPARLRHVDLRTARRLARENVDAIEEQIRKNKIPREQHPQRELFVNACQQLADCVLYHSHVIGPKYEFYREEADELYLRCITLTSDPRERCILLCKLALLRFLSGDIEAASKKCDAVVAEFSLLDPSGRNDTETPPVEFFLETLQGVAGFYLAPSPGEGRGSLRSVLDSFRLNTDSTKRCQGEQLDLQLLCIRLLLESSLADHDPVEAAADALSYLDPILLGTLAPEAEMRPFLRYYYDLAIRSCVPRDLGKPVEYIRCERMVPTRAYDSTHLVFYITQQDSFLIFLPKDRNRARRFDLPYTRGDIRDANAEGLSLTLPGDAVELIESECQTRLRD